MPAGSTILVVEDDPDLLTVVGALLQRSGYVVLSATSGREARKFLEKRTQQIDLILLDGGLEADDAGIRLVQELRAREAWKRVPIIAVTSHSFVSAGGSLLEQGFSAYLAKPVNHNHLLSTIQLLLAKR